MCGARDMPTRNKTGHRSDVPIQQFVHGDGGPCPYYPHLPGHTSHEAKLDQWQRCRREAWAATWRFDVPRAAEAFDGLTRRSWRLLWSTGADHNFDGAHLLEAIGADEEAICAFEQSDPQGARDVAEYLQLWRADLDVVRRCTEERMSAGDSGGLRIHERITSAAHYGDAVKP